MENFDFAMNNETKDVLYIEEIQEILKEALDADIQIEFDGLTYEIDEDGFRLTFDITDDYLTILNIEIVDGGLGMGKKIVETLHDFAEVNNLEVQATKVKTEAIGFWQALGYEESTEEGVYFLVN